MEDLRFYLDGNGGKRTLRPDLFSKVAQEWSKSLAHALSKYNKRTQIRKFYDEALRLNTLAKNSPGDWEDILPYVNMMVAKAAYAKGRDLVTDDFVKLIRDGIGQIREMKDLEVFCNFFESLMGFYKADRPKD